MTEQQYIEMRARTMGDPLWRNFIVRVIREELQNGIGTVQSEEGGGPALMMRPPGFISYQEAADLMGYHVASVRRMVFKGCVESIIIGQRGYVERAAMLRYIIRYGKVRQREKALALLGHEADATVEQPLMAVNG